MAIVPRTRKRDGKRVYDVLLRDPNGKEYSRTFPTKREAVAFEASERTDRRRGTWTDPRYSNLTVADVASRWLAANPAKRPNTYATDESAVRVHLEVWMHRSIGSITQPDVQGLVNAWSATAAPRTVKRRYGVLASVFAYAVSADWLGRSPCRDIHLPTITTTRRMSLDADQVEAIAEHTDPRYRTMVWIGAILGWRWEEVAGLRVGALDLLRGVATVAETNIRDQKGRPLVGQPKSTASRRSIAIPAVLVDVLAEHMAATGITAADPDRLLFASPEGGLLRYSNWRNRVWLPAVRAAGCEGAGFHDLRRANATQLVAGEVDVKTAQGRLGHSDSRLTIGLYAEVVGAVDRRAAETIGDVFLGSRDVRGMDSVKGRFPQSQ